MPLKTRPRGVRASLVLGLICALAACSGGNQATATGVLPNGARSTALASQTGSDPTPGPGGGGPQWYWVPYFSSPGFIKDSWTETILAYQKKQTGYYEFRNRDGVQRSAYFDIGFDPRVGGNSATGGSAFLYWYGNAGAATAVSSSCGPGTNGRLVDCSVAYDFHEDTPYTFVVERSGTSAAGTTWTGSITGPNGVRTIIGTVNVASSPTALLRTFPLSYVEYSSPNMVDCNDLPYAKIRVDAIAGTSATGVVAPGAFGNYFYNSPTCRAAVTTTVAPDKSNVTVVMGAPTPAPTPTPPVTTLQQIPHPLPTQPAKVTPPVGSVVAGGGGAQDVYYHYNGGPSGGYDALKYTMSPQVYHTPNEYYYWALQNYYQNSCSGCGYYFGLQPEGQYGKTALFSVFGSGTSSNPSYQYCASGADTGSGTSCHIPYNWTLGHFYDFTVTLVGSTASTYTWEGNVTDDNTGTTTLIGDVTVPSAWGLLSTGGSIAFDEYFGYQSHPCPNEPFSEILYLTPTGYRSGTPYTGNINSNGLVVNGGCNVHFYSDASTFAYVDAGY